MTRQQSNNSNIQLETIYFAGGTFGECRNLWSTYLVLWLRKQAALMVQATIPKTITTAMLNKFNDCPLFVVKQIIKL